MEDTRPLSDGKRCIRFIFLLSSLLVACHCAPLVARTTVAHPGILRPAQVATRDINLVQIVNNNGEHSGSGNGNGSGASASSSTGSSTSSLGPLGASSSSESSSGNTSSSSSSACVLFGGCTSSASAACQVVFDHSDITNLSTSSSLCGSGSSTDSTPFIQRTSDGADGVDGS